ncbi:protein ANTAGONIST OF LIKE HETEROCHROMATIN PROTEIN 1-like [Phragmites australis]|uniref:protein ANTAGONIST OF LIKE HETEROCHROMATIN PROTEIN 1-like n=1 Tax=Phragmites australis TaxID=29695 RepID=UPI002D79B61E|nr:protein ANTAGONIST OF LIKE HETEROCHROMATIN PROTEIN 1-like [Phragmites australis]
MDELAVKRRKIIAHAAGVVATMCAYTLFLYRRRGREAPISYGPLAERDKIRMENLRFIFHNDDRHCVEQLRMRRAPFFHLCTLLRTRRLLKDTIHSSIEEQVAMFLQVVGHNCIFRLIKLNFRRGLETISRYFREDCIGAIDGTHVLARVPASMEAAFRGRKGVTTQNVMAAVDFDLKFTYVLAGWEGSAHDAIILADALERDDGLRVPPGKFYLVDAGYAVRPGFLPPYRGCRYHLKEYGGRNNPRDHRELFNLRHSSLRVTVERAFGALKNRFKILYNKPFHPYKTQVKLVLACCILHNWILTHGSDECVPAEQDWTPNPVELEAHNDVAYDNNSWAAKRDEWALAMWNNRGNMRV